MILLTIVVISDCKNSVLRWYKYQPIERKCSDSTACGASALWGVCCMACGGLWAQVCGLLYFRALIRSMMETGSADIVIFWAFVGHGMDAASGAKNGVFFVL